MNTKKQDIKFYKHECSRAKNQLIYIEDKLISISKKEANKLSKIIIRLEKWQNTI